MGAKAGIDVNEALGAFGLAVELRSVKPVGMNYHIGSQVTHVKPYVQALDLALSLVERIEKARPDLKLYLEPGRAIAGNTAVLVSRIEAQKTKIVGLGAGRISRQAWLMIDAGFNTILEHSSYHWYFRAVVPSRCSKPPVRPFRIGGPLCDGGDIYTGDPGSAFRYLPSSTEAGAVIAFFDVGAYSLECMSAYNGRDQAAAYMVTESGLRQIAARRTVEDFVANERFVKDAAAE